MKTLLFSWTTYDWNDIDENIEQIQRQGYCEKRWQLNNHEKTIQEKCRFVLIRIGKIDQEYKGIIGYGETVINSVHQANHWDDNKKTIRYINLKFFGLSKTPFIKLGTLNKWNEDLGKNLQNWTPQGQPIIIKNESVENFIIEHLFSNDINNDDSILANIKSDPTLTETQKNQIILARVGQGKFRADVIKYWSKCCISDINLVEILIASHIKPWKKSSNEERLNPYNGLLLTPNLDKLFDKGYISFDDNGKILIANKIITFVNELGLHNNMKILLQNHHLKFMKFHREHIFIDRESK